MKLNEYLKQTRENLGKTQKEMAELCSTTINTIQNWEAGKSVPQSTLWDTIIDSYKMNPSRFMTLLANEYKQETKTEDKNFPYFLFKDPESVKKLVLTDEEQELYSLFQIYNDGTVWDESDGREIRIVSDENRDYLYNTSSLPYQYINKVGAFNVIALEQSLVNKLREGGSIYERFVFDEILKNPDKTFNIFDLPIKDVYNLAKVENPDLIEIFDTLKNMAETKTKISDPVTKKYVSYTNDGYTSGEKVECFELIDNMYDFLFDKEIRRISEEPQKSYYSSCSESVYGYYSINEVNNKFVPDYITITIAPDDDYNVLYEKWLADMKAYGEDPEHLEQPEKPEKKEYAYIELTQKGKDFVKWYKENVETSSLEEDE